MDCRVTCKNLCFILFFVMIFTGCGDKSKIDLTKNDKSQKNSVISDVQRTYENKVQTSNSYFMKKEKNVYKGDFTISDDRDTKDTNVECTYLGDSGNGKLYQLKLDSVEDLSIPEELLNLGYFYVREKEIFRILEMSEKEKKDFLLNDKIPNDATLVCKEEEKKDKNKKKGVHEKIIIKSDMIEYSYYDDSVVTNFYETFIWKKDVGMILYRRGYAAELNAITLWLEKYIDNPHEFSIS